MRIGKKSHVLSPPLLTPLLQSIFLVSFTTMWSFLCRCQQQLHVKEKLGEKSVFFGGGLLLFFLIRRMNTFSFLVRFESMVCNVRKKYRHVCPLHHCRVLTSASRAVSMIDGMKQQACDQHCAH